MEVIEKTHKMYTNLFLTYDLSRHFLVNLIYIDRKFYGHA